MNSTRNVVLLALNKIKNYGTKTIIDLYSQYDYISNSKEFSKESFFEFLEKDKCLNIDFIDELINNINQIKYELSKREIKDVSVISFFDDLYPYQLKLLKKPPLFLFCRGNTELLKVDNNVAVVGTRENSEIGKQVATKTAEYFATHNYTIVSGLAKGIDTYGHEGALNVSGKTIAILTDIMKIYPAENRDLADQILKSGGLLFSEIAPWQSVFRSAFVDRDRLQSGMSLGTFVIETDVIGGTMHTVKFTQEQKRCLFVPDYRLLPYKEGFPKINGTKYLLSENKAIAYSKHTYSEILRQLKDKKVELMKRYEIKTQNEGGLL